MDVIIDYREKAMKNCFDMEVDFNVTYDNLQIGDIHIIKKDGAKNNILILERKTIADLQHSLRDGRFSEQKKRIASSNFINKGYIIEGSLSQDKVFENIIRQLIIRIQFKDKMCVFLTGSVNDTTSLIKEIHRKLTLDPKLYDHNQPDKSYVETLHVCKKQNLDQTTCFILQLSQIPTISKSIAKVIVHFYPNWSSLIDGIKDKESFIANTKTAKIGPKRYEQLRAYII